MSTNLTENQKTAVVLAKLVLYVEHGHLGFNDKWQSFFEPECQFERLGNVIKLTFHTGHWLNLNRFDRSAADQVFDWVVSNIGNPGGELPSLISGVLRPYAIDTQKIPDTVYDEIGDL